ncbi:hypothetical protein H4R18_000326 [Coemansia javaensis]|uniref:Uncharacterized protein n=1 Tax=Coemansia javaensis TaxID=2761396 RepID=A0A9W8HNZ2_9FUNG|nr:hypothetical protein H4R18_000326 [Coemansia javaensis]
MDGYAIPDYIFVSGLSAQQSRSRRSSRRSSLRPTTPLTGIYASPPGSPHMPSSPHMPAAALDGSPQDAEIKEIIGHIHGAGRGWPRHAQLESPRLVRF